MDIPVERRKGPRPRAGELKVCPKCNGVMRFNEHWILTDAGGTQVETALWHCLNRECTWTEFVRSADS